MSVFAKLVALNKVENVFFFLFMLDFIFLKREYL